MTDQKHLTVQEFIDISLHPEFLKKTLCEIKYKEQLTKILNDCYYNINDWRFLENFYKITLLLQVFDGSRKEDLTLLANDIIKQHTHMSKKVLEFTNLLHHCIETSVDKDFSGVLSYKEDKK